MANIEVPDEIANAVANMAQAGGKPPVEGLDIPQGPEVGPEGGAADAGMDAVPDVGGGEGGDGGSPDGTGDAGGDLSGLTLGDLGVETDPFKAAMQQTSADLEARLTKEAQDERAAMTTDQRSLQLVDAVGTGVISSLTETGHFFGEMIGMAPPTYETMSDFERETRKQSKRLARASGWNSFAGTTAQFVTGMIGVGKAMDVIKLGQFASKAGNIGKLGYEVVKGGAAAAIVFDPNQDRLSDLLVQYPLLNTPVTQYLANDVDDDRAEGRLKNALEGMGMDLVVAGTLKAALKVFKWGRKAAEGDETALEHLADAKDELDEQVDIARKEAAKQNPKVGGSKAKVTAGADDVDGTDTVDEAASGGATGAGATEGQPVTTLGEDAQTGNVITEGLEAKNPRPTDEQLAQRMADLNEGSAERIGDPITVDRPKGLKQPANVLDMANTTGTGRAVGDAGQAQADDIEVAMNPPADVVETPKTTRVTKNKSSLGDAVKETAKRLGVKLTDGQTAKIDIKVKPKAKIETNGVGYSVLDEGDMGKIGEPYGINTRDWLGAADKKTGRIWISKKVMSLPENERADIIMHETGHVLEPKFVKAVTGADNATFSSLPKHLKDEMREASKILRPKHWDNAEQLVNVSKGKPSRMGDYLDTPSELFADSFALWKNNRAKFRKVAPQVAELFDTHFAPWLDHDFAAHFDDVVRLADEADAPAAAAPKVGPQGGRVKPKASKLTTMAAATDDEMDDFTKGLLDDEDALDTYGSRSAAEAAGHRFAKGGNLPYQKLNDDEGAIEVIEQVARVFEETMNKAKGAKVLTDKRLDRVVRQRVALFNENQAQVLGEIQAAGQSANRMVSAMEAGIAIYHRMAADIKRQVSAMKLGNYAEFGGDANAAEQALKDRTRIMLEVLSRVQAMRAMMGRGMRRLSGKFKPDEKLIKSIDSLTADDIGSIIEMTDGDPKMLAKMLTKGWWNRWMQGVGTLFSNNLLWGWKTHVANLVGNGWMMAVSPAQRAVGALAATALRGQNGPGTQVAVQALREYRYLGSAIGDALEFAKQAYLKGDSIISPYSNEYLRDAVTGTQTISGGSLKEAVGLKPVNNVNDAFSNLFSSLMFVFGQPNRALGMADEFMKQMSYRSAVLSKASVEADALKLAGKDYKDYLEQKLADSFDDNGQAINESALYDAQVRTFSQPLLPGTWGKTIAAGVGAHPELRLVLPFVRSPVNIFRYAVKMTPVLNLAQKEYRQMLSGALGPERQADAYGQMMTGGLLLASAYMFASNGAITGGPPPGWSQQKALNDTGWKPYSFRVDNPDGSHTYYPFSQYDPPGMVFGIVGDLVQIAKQGNLSDRGWEQLILPITIAISKNLANKSYLKSISDALDAAATQDPEAISQFIGGLASGLIPMSSALRTYNADPYMREARGITDQVAAGLPGFSDKLPVRRDYAGEPVLRTYGLMFTDKTADIADAEQQRILENFGFGIVPLVATPRGDVDMRKYVLKSGVTAFERYQELAMKPKGAQQTMKQALGELIQTDSYAKLPDGPASLKGTKTWALMRVVDKYRQAAYKQVLGEDPDFARATAASMQRVKTSIQNAVQAGDAVNTDVIGTSQAIKNANRTFGIGN